MKVSLAVWNLNESVGEICLNHNTALKTGFKNRVGSADHTQKPSVIYSVFPVQHTEMTGNYIPFKVFLLSCRLSYTDMCLLCCRVYVFLHPPFYLFLNLLFCQCAVRGKGASNPGLRGHPGDAVRPLRQRQQQLGHLAAHLHHLAPGAARPAAELPRRDGHLRHSHE